MGDLCRVPGAAVGPTPVICQVPQKTPSPAPEKSRGNDPDSDRSAFSKQAQSAKSASTEDLVKKAMEAAHKVLAQDNVGVAKAQYHQAMASARTPTQELEIAKDAREHGLVPLSVEAASAASRMPGAAGMRDQIIDAKLAALEKGRQALHDTTNPVRRESIIDSLNELYAGIQKDIKTPAQALKVLEYGFKAVVLDKQTAIGAMKGIKDSGTLVEAAKYASVLPPVERNGKIHYPDIDLIQQALKTAGTPEEFQKIIEFTDKKFADKKAIERELSYKQRIPHNWFQINNRRYDLLHDIKGKAVDALDNFEAAKEKRHPSRLSNPYID